MTSHELPAGTTAPNEINTDPYILSLIQGETASTIGISYLGGLALFSPLDRNDNRHLLAHAMVGQTPKEIASTFNLSVGATLVALDAAKESVGARSPNHIFEASLLLKPAEIVMVQWSSSNHFDKLSKNHRKVAGFLAEGLSVEQIADTMGIDASRVRNNVTLIGSRMGTNRPELIASGAVFAGLTGKFPKSQQGQQLWQYYQYIRQKNGATLAPTTLPAILPGRRTAGSRF